MIPASKQENKFVTSSSSSSCLLQPLSALKIPPRLHLLHPLTLTPRQILPDRLRRLLIQGLLQPQRPRHEHEDQLLRLDRIPTQPMIVPLEQLQLPRALRAVLVVQRLRARRRQTRVVRPVQEQQGPGTEFPDPLGPRRLRRDGRDAAAPLGLPRGDGEAGTPAEGPADDDELGRVEVLLQVVEGGDDVGRAVLFARGFAVVEADAGDGEDQGEFVREGGVHTCVRQSKHQFSRS